MVPVVYNAPIGERAILISVDQVSTGTDPLPRAIPEQVSGVVFLFSAPPLHQSHKFRARQIIWHLNLFFIKSFSPPLQVIFQLGRVIDHCFWCHPAQLLGYHAQGCIVNAHSPLLSLNTVLT
jgi:hypothetical protein